MIQILKYFNFYSFFKLVFLVFLLYYFTVLFNGIVSPEGSRYSAFLDHNLNYISWVRQSIMYVSNFIAHITGTNSRITGPQMMKLGDNIEVEIWLPCLGFGVMSFWISFIVNSTGKLKAKVAWAIGGVLSIWFINCLRIALLLISIDRSWPQSTFIDHHTLFNIAAYLCIVGLMYFHSRQNKHVGVAHEKDSSAAVLASH
jgi:exosortase/archaeosortase family protein